MKISLAENIAKCRKANGMTQERLAEALGVTCASVSKWERGAATPELTLIQQSVFVFNASIRDNITMFRDFPEADVERAIALSGLSALIAERGEDYLCREKQRIAIARSLLRKAQVLLCDEATAALDRQTADQVTDEILSLEGMTRIVVTHALDARQLRRFDAVIAMKGGEIAECGTFDELMAAKGYFYSLYTLAK